MRRATISPASRARRSSRSSRETTYADFLTKICGYDPQLVTYFQNSTEDYFGIGIDGTTALDAWGNWQSGL